MSRLCWERLSLRVTLEDCRHHNHIPYFEGIFGLVWVFPWSLLPLCYVGLCVVSFLLIVTLSECRSHGLGLFFGSVLMSPSHKMLKPHSLCYHSDMFAYKWVSSDEKNLIRGTLRKSRDPSHGPNFLRIIVSVRVYHSHKRVKPKSLQPLWYVATDTILWVFCAQVWCILAI